MCKLWTHAGPRGGAWRSALLRGLVPSIGLVLALLLSQTAPAVALGWANECVDCPQYLNLMTDRSLRLDGTGHPHIAYGGDHLYYTWYDGATWHSETVDPAPGVGFDAALALDAAGYAHISYHDSLNGALKFAHQDASGWHLETVDSGAGGDAGYETSIALDTNGYAHISYNYAESATEEGDLRYAYQNASGWHIETVDSAGDVGYDTSLALDASGYPHISYDDWGLWSVKYAYKNVSGWHVETVDNDTADMTSIAVDGSGRPHISYDANDTLGYAYRDGTGWHFQTVDSGPLSAVGWYSSLALDAAGRPHISYQVDQEASSGDLKYAYYDGAAWQIATLDPGANPADNVGFYTSLALTGSGHAHISYFDITNGAVKYGFYNGSAWTVGVVVDAGDNVGQHNAIALDAQGQGRVAYYAGTSRDLKYAYQDATGWHTQSVDTAGDVGQHASLAVDANGFARISYFDFTNDDLKYAYQDASGWHTQAVDAAGGRYTSLALASDGTPHISYRAGATGELRHAYLAPGGWQVETLDSNLGWYVETSIALDGSGYPRIAYGDDTNDDLKYAYKDATGWHLQIVDSSGRVGRYPSLDLGPNGYGHISYYGGTTGILRYARWTGSTWQKENVDLDLGLLGDTSLVVDAAGRVYVSYYDYNNRNLKVGVKDGGSWQLQVAAPHSGWYTSLALDGHGQPHIAYYDQATYDLRVVANCVAVSGTSVAGPGELLVGETGQYTASTTPLNATLPIFITWDNGTVGPTAAYSWAEPGNYVVQATAQNCGGTASGTRAVTVSEAPPCPDPLTGVSIGGPSAGYTGTPYTFDAAIEPPGATQPVTYHWTPEPSAGQGTASAEYQWATPGTYEVTVAAENCGGPVSATHSITISDEPPPCPDPLTGVSIGGPSAGYTDIPYTFDAAIEPSNATAPITYAWTPEPSAGQGTASAEYQWATPGTYEVAVTAENCGGPVSATHSITISEPPVCPYPLTGVTITGPSVGYTGFIYPYSAAIEPSNATTPVSYNWSPAPRSGQGTATVTYSWSVTGPQTINVTASNCGGTVSDGHAIMLVRRVYLPVILRGTP